MPRRKPVPPASVDPASLQVVELPIDQITEYPNNPRQHSIEQIELIARSIREFGWTNPCIIDANNELIAGHGRLAGARLVGLATIPCIRLSHLTPAQKRALVIADNKIAITGTQWDFTLLKLELANLKLEGFDLSLSGFDDAEINALFGGAGLTDPDSTPPVPPNPVTVPLDVWIMSRHRVMCGDSTSPQDVDALMGGVQADLCFTSPPYGQQRDYKAAIGDWDALMQGVFSIMPVTRTAQVLVNLGMIHRKGEWVPYWDGWVEWMRATGWRRFGWYVWDQGPGLPGDWNGRLAPAHEWIFHFNQVAEKARKTKAKLAASIQYNDHGNGMRMKDGTMSGVSSPEKSLQTHKIPDSVVRVLRRLDEYIGAVEALSDDEVSHWPDSVVRVMRHKARGIETKHPAVFPVALPAEILLSYSDVGDTLYEPFCGAGSTVIAAEMHGRACFGMEIAAAYADLSVIRWQNFTGREATLEATGETFAAVSAARSQAAA